MFPKHTARFLLGTASIIALASAASAADIPVRPIAVKAPPVLAPSWTGPYAGLNLGAAWHKWVFRDVGGYGFDPGTVVWSEREASLTAGGQIGYNYQIDRFVVGLEADLNWLNSKDSTSLATTAFPGVARFSTRLDWLGTLRVRAGITTSPTLWYLTGGLAAGRVDDRWNVANVNVFTSKGTRTGWTAGGGVEHKFAPNLSGKIEALYVDLGHKAVTNNPFGSPYRSDFKHSAFILRGGLNWIW
jgi:outer membrane immunogenic protein